MRIGILSDSHGDASTTARAVKLLEARGAEALIHCGDICGDKVLAELAGKRAWFVWGNCDDPSPALRAFVRSLDLPWPDKLPVRVTLAGRRIGVCHGHERGFDDWFDDPDLDYLLYGHTHRFDDHRGMHTRAVNPGALYRARVKTVALLNLATDELKFLSLDGMAVEPPAAS